MITFPHKLQVMSETANPVLTLHGFLLRHISSASDDFTLVAMCNVL